MNPTDLLRRVARAEHTLISTPLHAAARRLPDDSTVRLTLERGVGLLDAAAEHFLGGDEPAGDEPARDEQVESPRSPDSARAGNRTGADAPTGDGSPAHAVTVERVTEELEEELDEAPLVGELADSSGDEKQQMAELRARHVVEEYEAEQAARHARFEES